MIKMPIKSISVSDGVIYALCGIDSVYSKYIDDMDSSPWRKRSFPYIEATDDDLIDCGNCDNGKVGDPPLYKCSWCEGEGRVLK